MTRDQAWQIVCEHVKDTGLRRHMVAVESAMRSYAPRLGGDAERWGLAGLLHDFDWEIHPTLTDHPAKGAAILRARGVDEEIVRCILSHNPSSTGISPASPMEFALTACDEITGLIIATALVGRCPQRWLRFIAAAYYGRASNAGLGSAAWRSRAARCQSQ